MGVVGLSFVVLASLLAIVRVSPADAATSVDELRSQPTAVIVSARMSPRHDAVGAGVIVAVDAFIVRVVTARHVTDFGEVTVWIDGAGYPAEVVRTFAHRDLAIVDVVVPNAIGKRLTVAEIATDASVDEALVIWGENEAGPRVERGRVVATEFAAPDDAQAPPLLAISCETCAPGDSGGGIFGTDGRLIGILVARYLARDHHIIATVGEFVTTALFADSNAPVAAATTTVLPARR